MAKNEPHDNLIKKINKSKHEGIFKRKKFLYKYNIFYISI